MKKRILILGSNGYLGSQLCEALKQIPDYFVIGVSRGEMRNTNVDLYVSLDLSKKEETVQISNLEFDLVFDFISYIQPNEHSLKLSQIDTRLQNFYFLITTILKDIPLIFISSAGTVYGDSLNNNFEDSPRNGLTPYAKQKIIQEDYLLKNHSNPTILRVTNPYGGNQIVKHGVGFMARALSCIQTGETLIVTVPLETKRNYIYIGDVIDTFIFFIHNNHHEKIYNIASNASLSLAEVIEKIETFSNKKMNITLNLDHFNKTTHIIQNNV